MAITYPLNTPTNIGIANITLMAESAVAVSQSPFTFTQQVVAHPGQRWAASVSLPPMKRVDAENWIAFLLSLKGQVGTFLLGDPNGVNDQGVAATRRNMLTYTEQFDNAAWVKTRIGTGVAPVVTPNADVAPNGTLSADRIDFDRGAGTSGSDTSVVTRSFINPGLGLAGSFYVKAATPSDVGKTILFRHATGAAYTTITLTANWVRETNISTGPGTDFQIASRSPSSQTVSILLWGAQLEEGSAASAYQGVVDTFGPFVNGANQTGNVLNIDGCSPNVTGYFLPGDYIQLGSGSGSQLYKVLTSVDTNNSGQATVDIWPNLRSSPADNSTVVFTNAKGKFRLKDNVTQWGINEISSYGITFDCVEAL